MYNEYDESSIYFFRMEEEALEEQKKIECGTAEKADNKEQDSDIKTDSTVDHTENKDK